MKRKYKILAGISMMVGALLGLTGLTNGAIAQAPSCNNSMCEFVFLPYDDWCKFLPDSSCWYNENSEIRCKLCAIE